MRKSVAHRPHSRSSSNESIKLNYRVHTRICSTTNSVRNAWGKKLRLARGLIWRRLRNKEKKCSVIKKPRCVNLRSSSKVSTEMYLMVRRRHEAWACSKLQVTCPHMLSNLVFDQETHLSLDLPLSQQI